MDKKNQKRIGLALSGGGARGIVHLGILQVLEEHKIPISIIAGTSMGAFIGGPYAAGVPLTRLNALIQEISKHKIVSWANFNIFRESLLKWNKVEDYWWPLVDDILVEDVKIPFVAMATDLESGNEVELRHGSLLKVMMASGAYPGIFPPVFFNGRYLVDGGILNNIPVNVIRPEADIVIGVNLKNYTSRQFISGMAYDKYYRKLTGWRKWLNFKRLFFYEWKLNFLLMGHVVMRTIDIARREATLDRLKQGLPDILIEPDVENFSFFGFKDYDQIIEAGRNAAKKALPQIKALRQF